MHSTPQNIHCGDIICKTIAEILKNVFFSELVQEIMILIPQFLWKSSRICMPHGSISIANEALLGQTYFLVVTMSL